MLPNVIVSVSEHWRLPKPEPKRGTMSIIPVTINRPKPYLLTIEWSDGLATTITLRTLRDNCPCAVCKGETIMGTTYSFGLQVMKPGMYELQALTSSGNYGIQATWADGHSTGIYTWELLHIICHQHQLNAEQLSTLERKQSNPE